MKNSRKQPRKLPPLKRNFKERKEVSNSFVPFSVKLEGSIVESFARILRAVCRLIEEDVDLSIFWLHKKRQK